MLALHRFQPNRYTVRYRSRLRGLHADRRLGDGEPFKKRTKVDESEPEGTRYVKTAGADGRSVTVHRTVRDRAGNVLHEEDFTSNYAPIDEVTAWAEHADTRERRYR